MKIPAKKRLEILQITANNWQTLRALLLCV